MSHEINIRNGKAAFFAVKEPAWHKLGTVVKEALTSEEAIIKGGLDYEVKLADVKFDAGDKIGLTMPLKYITYRSDTNTPLGLVGRRYDVIQNRQAFEVIDNIVGNKEAIFHTAGALGKGERIFLSAKLPDNIYVKGKPEEKIENYIVVTTSHDGENSMKILLTPIRVVCNNTLNFALQTSKNIMSINHTSKSERNIRYAIDIMNMARHKVEQNKQIYDILAEIKVNEDNIKNIIGKIFIPEAQKVYTDGKLVFGANSTRLTNTLNSVVNSCAYGIGQDTEYTADTMYGLFNGIQYYLNNVKSYRDETKRFDNTALFTHLNNKITRVILHELNTINQEAGEEIINLLN